MPLNWLGNLQQLISTRYQECFGVSSLSDAQEDIERWFDSGLAHRMLLKQQQHLDDILPQLFGYHLMQMSVLKDVCLFGESKTRHQFALHPESHLRSPSSPQFSPSSHSISSLSANLEALPFSDDMVDVTLLHHVLDFSETPQRILREATRVTLPSGYIVIVGFNPFSWMGLARPAACLSSKQKHWHQQQLRVGRLLDWFEVLGLEVESCHRSDFGLPINRHYSPKIDEIGKNLFPLCGNFYILLARKMTTPLTPISPPWKNKKLMPQWVKPISASSCNKGKLRPPNSNAS